MTTLDILIVAILVVFSVWGLMRGLIGEVFSLASWFGALFVGSHFGHWAQPLFEDWIAGPALRGLLSCLAVGVLAFALISIVGGLLSRKIQASVFGPVDRMLGMLFGAARGSVVVGVLVLVGLQFGLKEQGFWKAAKLSPMATTAAELLDNVVDLRSLMKDQGLVDLPVPEA